MLSDSERIGRLENEVARLAGLVEGIARQLGVPVPDAVASSDKPPADIVDAIRAGNDILAIKLWRDRTGAPLGEAKARVDELARRLSA